MEIQEINWLYLSFCSSDFMLLCNAHMSVFMDVALIPVVCIMCLCDHLYFDYMLVKPQLHILESGAEWATNRESGWVVAESGWFGVNRSKFVVSRDDSWWFLADRELAPKTLKSLMFLGPSPESSRIKMIRHDSWLLRGRVGRNRGSFGVVRSAVG